MKNSQKEAMAFHIEQWSSSGLSKATYCKNAGISYHTFNYHVKGKRNKSEASGFELIEARAATTARIELHLPGGSYFSIPENCSISVLEKLVSIC